MKSKQTPFLDEAAFKQWLHASFEMDSIDADRIASHARDVVNAIDIVNARTDEQVYISLFSQHKFRASSQERQAQIKKAAILANHYFKRGTA